MPSYSHIIKIASLPRRNVGEATEVISEIHVAITTSDGTNTLTLQAFAYTIPEEVHVGPYIPIEDLDPATILGWIPAKLLSEWKTTMEARVAEHSLRLAASARSDVPYHLTQ